MILEANAYAKHEKFLEHYGVKGMKWGVRKSYEKARTLWNSKLSDIKKKKTAKKRAATLKKARKKAAANRKKNAQFKKNKSKIVKSPTKLLKNKDRFTNDEIKEALNRFDLEKRLADASKNQMTIGKTYLDAIWQTMNSGATTYNQVARLYNTFIADENSRIPYIEPADAKKNKPKRRGGDSSGGNSS